MIARAEEAEVAAACRSVLLVGRRDYDDDGS